MKIVDVYKKYSVPPNLARHMQLVAGVAGFIADHWTGNKLDKEKLIKLALLHDLGNIVRFDFDKHPEFLEEEQTNLDFWKKEQQKIVSKYGSDDHETTRWMLNELGFDDNSLEVISSKSFINSKNILLSNDWNLKILLYSDMRVSPQGVISLEKRLEEIRNRRVDLTSRPDFNNQCDACAEIEKEVQKNVNLPLSEMHIVLDPSLLEIDI